MENLADISERRMGKKINKFNFPSVYSVSIGEIVFIPLNLNKQMGKIKFIDRFALLAELEVQKYLSRFTILAKLHRIDYNPIVRVMLEL